MARFVEAWFRRFFAELWPFGEPRPETFYDPRQTVERELVSLHARCVVVDDREVLVTSANFTGRGQRQTGNIELGVRIEDPTLATAVAQLRGEHLVQVHDYGVHDGLPYFVMERLFGESLQSLIVRHAPLEASAIFTLAEGLARARPASTSHTRSVWSSEPETNRDGRHGSLVRGAVREEDVVRRKHGHEG